MKNQIISGILAVSVLAGVTSCSGTVKDNGKDEAPTAAVTTAAAEDRSEDMEETAGQDDISVTDDAASAGGSSSDAGTGFTVPPELTEDDDILFTYSYSNMAWGFTHVVTLVTRSGDLYTSEDWIGLDPEIALLYLKTYAKPNGHLDPEKIADLYEACLEISPDAKTSEVQTAYDMGNYVLNFRNQETGEEITVFKRGDFKLETEDEALSNAMDKAERLMGFIPAPTPSYGLHIYPNMLNVPYGGEDLIGTHKTFDSYEKLESFCLENGIDIEPYMSGNVKSNLQEASAIVLQVFDTNCPVDGYLRTGKDTFIFLPTLAAYEYNPEFEGKVTVAICRNDLFAKQSFVDENGDLWQ